MEQEYKWQASPQLIDAVLLWATAMHGKSHIIFMRSVYYDTVDGLLRGQNAALRLRQENDRSVCCMKLRNQSTAAGMRAHEEFECEAPDVYSGVIGLEQCGAPAELCRLALDNTLIACCEVDFTRCAVTLKHEGTTCELALDQGTLKNGDHTAPLCEIELERKKGKEAPFHALADMLSAQFSLIPETESKLARAFALAL